MPDEQYLQWQAPEFHYTDKTPRWYLLVLLFAIIMALFAIWQQNMMFLVLIVVGAIVVLSFSRRKPTIINYAIVEGGIAAQFPHMQKDEEYRLYPFSDYSGFAIHDNPLHPEFSEIVLHPRQRLRTHTIIMIPDEVAQTASDQLNYILDEFEHEESLADHLSKWLGL